MIQRTIFPSDSPQGSQTSGGTVPATADSQDTVRADSVDTFVPLRMPPRVSDSAQATGSSHRLAERATKEKVGRVAQRDAKLGGHKAVHTVRVLTAARSGMRVAYHHKPFAKGGYARVYRGVDVNTGVPVVVKKLTPKDFDKFWRDTDNELRAAALTGSHVVPSHLFKTVNSANKKQIYQVLPWMRGDVFHALSLLYVSEQDSETLDTACRLALHVGQQVAWPLAQLHQAKWAHRDIKPDNFFRAPDHQLKVADFGFAAHADSREALRLRMSPHYAAPEVLRGLSEPIEAWDVRAADVYSLGATLMHICLPRTYLFIDAPGPREVEIKRLARVHKVFKRNYESLTLGTPFETTEGLAMAEDLEPLAQPVHRLLLAMMHPNPQERPSMLDVAEDLDHPDFELSQADHADIQDLWRRLDEAAASPQDQLHDVTQWLEREAWPEEAAEDGSNRTDRLRSRLRALE